MPPKLRAFAASQAGLFTRRQAVAAGCSERELKTRTGALGDWVAVRRGVYAERAVWDRLDDEERYRTCTRAALLSGTKPATASHSSAAALLQLPTRPHWRSLVHVTRPGVTGGRTEGGVKHHRASLPPEVVSTVNGVHVTALARTAVDIGREFGFEDGVVAADAALRQGARREDLEASLAAMRCWPGVTRAKAAVAVADSGAESIGETFLRLLLLELGIGRPQTQFEVVSHGRRAFVDLRVGRHLFEFDGRVKYLGREQGGVADRRPEDVVWDEKRREDWLRNHDGGYGMSRVVWSELWGRARDDTKRRLTREFTESQRRFGHLG